MKCCHITEEKRLHANEHGTTTQKIQKNEGKRKIEGNKYAKTKRILHKMTIFFNDNTVLHR